MSSRHVSFSIKAEVYKEDFLKERRDRERLKDKYLELEKKFRKVYNELRVLKSQVPLIFSFSASN